MMESVKHLKDSFYFIPPKKKKKEFKVKILVLELHLTSFLFQKMVLHAICFHCLYSKIFFYISFKNIFAMHTVLDFNAF